MSTMTDILRALQSDIAAAVASAAATQFSDLAVSLDTAKKRLADGQQALAHTAEQLRFSRKVWELFCGPAVAESTTGTSRSEAPRLLDCVVSLQDAACASTGSSSAKSTSETLQLLRVALTPALRAGASVVQLMRLKSTVWALLITLDVVNKLKDAQTEGFLLMADLLIPVAPGGEAQDPAVLVLSAAQLGATEVLQRCVSVAGKAGAAGQRLRAVALHLMGSLMGTYPEALGSEQDAVRRAFEQAAHRLAQQQEVEQTVGEGLLDGLSSFLSVFPLHFGTPSEQPFIIFIHQLVKNALLLAESSTNYRFCTAALRFLATRAVDTLAECIFDDSMSYLSLLHKLWLHKNRNVHRVAYTATPSCLQALSQQLVSQSGGEASVRVALSRRPEDVLEDVLGMVKRILSTTSTADGIHATCSNPAELSFVFVVCGHMARPLRVCITTEALEALFGQVIDKIGWLFPSITPAYDEAPRSAGAEDVFADEQDDEEGRATVGGAAAAAPTAAGYLPGPVGHEDAARLIRHLLEAFSCFLAEVPRVTSEAQRALSSLLEATLQMLPSDLYFARLRVATITSVLKLLMVTEHRACMELDVCAYVCERITWLACVIPDSGRVAGAEAVAALPDDDAPRSTAPTQQTEAAMPVWWRRTPVRQRHAIYAEFLRALLVQCGACQPAQWGPPWSALDARAVGRRLREALSRTVLSAVDVLDVAVLVKGQPASTNLVLAHVACMGMEDPAADALRPRTPSDYGFLLNLTDLHSALAGCLWSDLAGDDACERLSRWVLSLAHASRTNPHVSGYYALLYTALQPVVVATWRRERAGRASLLTTEADAALARWQRHCAQRLSTYTQELLYQCAAAYITMLAARTVRPLDSGIDDADVPHPFALQQAFTVVLSAAGASPEAGAERANTEATVSFVLRALAALVQHQPRLATHLLPALLAAPELAERDTVRTALGDLTARYGDRMAAAMQGAADDVLRERDAASGTVSRGLQPPPRWRTQKALLALPFPSDVAVAFPLTVVLARAAYLSCHAGPSHVRSPAAELLHFAVVWLLGAGKKEAERDDDVDDAGAVSWLPTVLPAMLHLASGHAQDGVAQALFHDLLLQTARWTSLLRLRWPRSSAAVMSQRALEKVLCDHLSSHHAPLRRVAAEALEAYIGWGAEQAAAVAARGPAPCAGVLDRIRLDLRAAHHPWARLGAVTLLRCLLVRMRHGGSGSAGAGTGRTASVAASSAPPALCTLLLGDCVLWLSALVACLRCTLRPPREAATATHSHDSVDAEDACGIVAESVAAFEALHSLLTEAGAAGAATRHAIVHRQGAAASPPSAEPALPVDDPLAGLLRDVLELCWLLCARGPLEAVTSLWSVLDGLCACLRPCAAEDDRTAPLSAMAWLHDAEGGEAALCALLARGPTDRHTDDAALTASLSLCAFLSTRRAHADGAGVKRPRSPSPTSRLSLATVAVVHRAVQRLSHASLVPTPAEAALLTALSRLLRASMTAEGLAVDWTAVCAAALVKPVFELAARGLGDLSARADVTSDRTMGTLCALAKSSSSPSCEDALMAAACAALPADFVAPHDSASVRAALAQPLSARRVLASLSAVAALAALPQPARRGSLQILSDVLGRLPAPVQARLRDVWLSVLRHVLLEAHGTALAHADHQALMAHLVVVCLCMGPPVAGQTDLPRSLAYLVGVLAAPAEPAAACTVSPASPAASMVSAAQACTAALRRLVNADDDRARGHVVNALVCTLCEAVRGPLFGVDDGADRTISSTDWQAEHALPALLLLQLVHMAKDTYSGGKTPRITQTPAGTDDVVRCLLSPLLPAAPEANEENEENAQARHAALAVWRDPARMSFVLRLLCAMAQGPRDWTAALQHDTQITSVVSALAAAGGSGERWTGSPHMLLGSTVAVRLLQLAVRVLCGAGLASTAPPRAYLDCARSLLLTTLTEELPLDWKELATDSAEAAALPHVVHSLVALAGVMASHEPEILTRLLPLLAQTDLPDAQAVADTVRAAIAALSPAGRLALCEACVGLQQGGGGLPQRMWWAATYRLMLPVLFSFSTDERLRFFCAHVVEWVAEAGRVPPPLSTPHRQTNALVLLESMYRLTDGTTLRGPINEAFVAGRTGPAGATTGKELMLAIIKLCNTARTAAPAVEPAMARRAASDEEDGWLVYRQTALRCLVAVAMATQQQEAVFVKLLLDAANVDGWEKVVDGRAAGVLPVECGFPHISEYAAKGSSDWELRSRRPTARVNVAQQVGSLLDNILADERLDAAATAAGGGDLESDEGMGASNSLWFASSAPFGGRLSTAMMMRTTTDSAAAAGPGRASTTVTLAMDAAAAAAATDSARATVVLDGVWRSTCLGALFSALDFMIASFTAVPAGAWAPAWVVELWKLLVNPAQPVHVKLVVVRLIVLRPAFFARYGEHLVEPMVEVVSDPSLGKELHYVAREVLCVVLDWMQPAADGDGNDDADEKDEKGQDHAEENKWTRRRLAPLAAGQEEEAVPALTLSTTAATKLLRYVFATLLVGSDSKDSEAYVLRNNLDLFKAVCAAMGPAVLSTGLGGVPVLDLLTTASIAATTAATGHAPSRSVQSSSASSSSSFECMEEFVQLMGVLVNSGICLATVWEEEAGSTLTRAITTSTTTTASAVYTRLAWLVLRGDMSLAVAAAEVLAVELQTLAQRGAPDPRQAALEAQVRDAVEAVWSRAPVTALHVLRVVEAYRPGILTQSLAALVLTGFSMRNEEEQLLILDVLGSAPGVAASLYGTISAQFAGVLGSFRSAVRSAVYTLLQILAPLLSVSAVCQLVSVFLSDASLAALQDSSDEARTRFFQLVLAAHSRLHQLAKSAGDAPAMAAVKDVEEDEDAAPAARRARDRLLHLMTAVGLGETSWSPFVQDIILAHLDELQYPDDPAARVAAVLQSLSPSSGSSSRVGVSAVGQHTHWLRHLALLLLSPCRRTRAYGDTTYLFDAPLADCRFAAKRFPDSATRGTHGRQSLPLFSDSLASLGARAHASTTRGSVPFTYVGASQRAGNTPHASNTAAPTTATARPIASMGAPPSQAYRGVRRRPALVFPSSVQSQGLTAAQLTTHQCPPRTGPRAGASQVRSQLLVPRAAAVVTGSLVSGRTGRELVARRLHALPEAGREVMFMAAASRDRQERERRDTEQRLAQLHHRVLFRLYREGDLPDVQVPIAAFLAPLQALCLYDAVTAQLTSLALLKALVPSPPSTTTTTTTAAAATRESTSPAPDAATALQSAQVPFFARPTTTAAAAAAKENTATAQRALSDFLVAATTTALRPTTPALTLHALQELLLYVELPRLHRQRGVAEEEGTPTDTASVVAQSWAALARVQQGGLSAVATDDTTGAAVLMHEQLVASPPFAGPGSWFRLAELLGQVGEPDALCAALKHAASTNGAVMRRKTTTTTDACVRALQAALHAEAGGAYEQAMALFATCVAALPSSALAAAGQSEAVRDLLRQRQTHAARAILQWQTVQDLCTTDITDTTDEAGAARPLIAAVESAAMALEASRHIAVRAVPDAFARLCRLSGGRLSVVRDRPFEAVAASLLAGQLAQSEEQAHHAIAHVLQSFRSGSSSSSSSHVRPDADAARVCQEAFRLRQAQRVAGVLVQVAEAHPSAPEAAQRLATRGFPPLASPTPLLADSALWLLRTATHALEGLFRQQFGAGAWAPIGAALARTQLELCRTAAESLLRAPRTNGAVKALLDAAATAVPEPLLYATALRANLYRLAHFGSQRSDIRTDALIEGLQRRVQSQADALPAEERRRLEVDVDWCAMCLILQDGQHHAASASASASVLADFFTHATRMHAQLLDSVDEHVRLLSAVDRMLAAPVRRAAAVDGAGDKGVETETDNEDDDADEKSRCAATAAHRQATWRLYLATFAWVVEAIGAGRVADAGARADVAMQVPRTLQFFDHMASHPTHETAEEDAALMDRLLALPVSIWLPWPSQLVSTALRTRQLVPVRLLLRLADASPQIVYYPWHCAEEELRALQVDPTTPTSVCAALAQLRQVLEESPRVRRARLLARSLIALHEPRLRLREALRELAQIYRGCVEATAAAEQRADAYRRANGLFQVNWRLFADASTMAPQETVRLKFCKLAMPLLSKFAATTTTRTPTEVPTLCESWEQFKKAYQAAAESFNEAGKDDVATARIEEYSVILDGLLCHATDRVRSGAGYGGGGADEDAEDEATALEMPVQPVLRLSGGGGGRRAGLSLDADAAAADSACVGADAALQRAEYIVGANPLLRVQSSLQRPKRLELYSSLMNSHVYLAKGGDDLRLDQRVEELFAVLNQHLQRQSDGAASVALSVHTYSVIPLSAQVGLVQWVPQTTTLQSVMDRESGYRLTSDTALLAYGQRYQGGTQAYLDSFLKDSPAKAAAWYEALVKKTPHGLLARGLLQMSPSLTHWYSVRDGFVKSNAALSISAHVFGIGDRHLSNFLIATGSGRLIGIDYGHAFGSATEELPIPELVPFRITPQVRAACGVLGEAVLASAMGRVLHTLRQHRSVIESLAQAFVQEPLTQWKKLMPAQRALFAARKLRGVARKLDLDAPWNSLYENLRHNRNLVQHGNLLVHIREAVLYVPPTGDARDEEQPQVEDGTNPAQSDVHGAEAAYVQQLLDLAQNSAVLSRAYIGWNPLF